MKIIITLLAFALCFAVLPAQAQNVDHNSQLTGTSVDTLTNATTGTYYLVCKGTKSAVTFQYNIAKISGTVAGTIKVYGSIDNTNYVLLDTYTITDASAIGGYTRVNNGYTKYKVLVTTTGTQSSSYDLWAMYRN